MADDLKALVFGGMANAMDPMHALTRTAAEAFVKKQEMDLEVQRLSFIDSINERIAALQESNVVDATTGKGSNDEDIAGLRRWKKKYQS